MGMHGVLCQSHVCPQLCKTSRKLSCTLAVGAVSNEPLRRTLSGEVVCTEHIFPAKGGLMVSADRM